MIETTTRDSNSNMERQRWMGALSTAPAERLSALWHTLGDIPDYAMLRAPESGLVMARGRTGGTGAPFNLGEMTVTRCSVRLEDGTVGHAYLAGRDRIKAERAAVLDALLQQSERAGTVFEAVIKPLINERAERDAARAAKVAATKVDFFTMVRGED